MRQWMKLALLGLFASALTGCGGDGDGPDFGTSSPPEQQTQLRILHGAADAPPVDVLVDGEEVLSDVAYRDGSGYLPVEPGIRDIRINPAGTQSAVIQDSPNLADNTAYSLLALGSAEDQTLETLLLEDDTSAPDTGNVRVRVVHGSPDAPAVDVFITEPNLALADATPTFTNVTFREASQFVEVAAGTYQIRVRPTSGGTVSIYDSGPVTLQEGTIITVVALPTPGNTQSIGLVALGNDAQNPIIQLANVQETRVRAVHAIPNGPPVSVLVDDGTIASGLEYGQATGYLNVLSGSPRVQINSSADTDNGPQTLIDATTTFDAGQPYTLIALGSQPDVAPLLLQDRTAGPSARDALVRVVHAADQVPAVDVYITPPDALLGQATPVVSAAAFQDVSGYLTRQPGDYRIRITPTGTQEVVFDSGQITLSAGDVLTVVAIPATGGTSPVRLLALSSRPTEASFAIADVNARVRAVHASPDAPPVDVLVDGEVAASGLAFGEATDYAQVTATDGPTVTINAAETGNPVLEASPALMRGTDYTLMVVNNLADIEPLLLTDDQTPPEPGNGKVRLVHASPDAPAVDILVDDEVVASDVAFKGSSEYLQLPAGDHTVTIREAGTDMAVFETDVTVEEGTIYTVAAINRLTALQALVLTDN